MSREKELFETMINHYENLLQGGVLSKEELENGREGTEESIRTCRREIKKIEYKKCQHLWVSLPSEDELEDRLLGCVKCGLNNGFIL